jgi:hypothetical protein
MIPLLLIVGFLAGAVVLSLAVEALRPRPEAPQRLYWDPAITIQYAVIDGLRIRHIKSGRGPNLVLLHTLRTQLDVFENSFPGSPKLLPCLRLPRTRLFGHPEHQLSARALRQDRGSVS